MKRLNISLHFIRKYLSYAQLPYTDLYIIPRNQLHDDANTVQAKRVRIFPETVHFLVDYQNPEGKITLFAGHTAASDPAVFLHGDDTCFYSYQTKELKERAGMFVSPMDANRLGCWVIDVEKLHDFESDPEQKEACKHFLIDHFESKETKEKEYLFSLSLYAWSGFQPDQWGMGKRKRQTISNNNDDSLPIVEVQGWQINRQGEVELVAHPNGMIGSNSGNIIPSCQMQRYP